MEARGRSCWGTAGAHRSKQRSYVRLRRNTGPKATAIRHENLEGVTGKTADARVRPHIFASVECLGLYFNRTHHTQNLLFF